MRKKLKTNGSRISSYQVTIVPYTVETGEIYQKISLWVISESVKYAYDINKDVRHPDLQFVKKYLDSSFLKAINENLNVKISEYPERFYLFVEFQSIGQQQYTGRRTA